MSQPEETQAKTDKTDDVLLHPNEDPLRDTDQVAPRKKDNQGRVRVERDGQLRPADEEPS